MFDLKNTEKYRSREERRLKTATVIVAAATIGLYIIFILLMLITKLGILSAFIHTKPAVDSNSIYKDPVYGCLNYEFYYKRFNWLFDGKYDRLYLVFNDDLNENEYNKTSELSDYVYSRLDWLDLKETAENSEVFVDFIKPKLAFVNAEDSETVRFYKFKIEGHIVIPTNSWKEYMRYTYNYNDGKFEFKLVQPNGKIPSGLILFSLFGFFMLISAAYKVLSIAKSYHNGKLEFKHGMLGVKIMCIFEAFGVIALTYVFFWVYLWKIPMFYNMTEPSMIYYFLFLIPVIALNILYAFLYNEAADKEK